MTETNSNKSRTRKGKIKENIRKLWKYLSRSGLSVFFVLYTIAGAKVFQLLEHPSEVDRHREGRVLLVEARNKFLNSLSNMSTSNADTYRRKVSSSLELYESAVEMADKNGVSPVTPNITRYKWNFAESIFFASTIITTIGYGNMAPVTNNGRAFCILYGFIGIPVTLSVIAELGTFFANMVSILFDKIQKCIKPIKFLQSKNSKISDKTKRGLIVLGAVGSLLLYLSVGAGLFITWEDWTFFEAFYFCFITMTTIGLGDFVPERTELILVCTLYILIGLALTSTIIELIRRQYAESWQQMKELSGRLGELSGPLADHLKRLGAHDLNLDLRINSDFKDMVNAIQMHRLEALYKLEPKWKNDNNLAEFLRTHFSGSQSKEDEEEEEAFLKKKKVVQIIIYESSV